MTQKKQVAQCGPPAREPLVVCSPDCSSGDEVRDFAAFIGADVVVYRDCADENFDEIVIVKGDRAMTVRADGNGFAFGDVVER